MTNTNNKPIIPNNNKKTYEVRYVEQRELSRLEKALAYFLPKEECSDREVARTGSSQNPSLWSDSQTQASVEATARGVRNAR